MKRRISTAAATLTVMATLWACNQPVGELVGGPDLDDPSGSAPSAGGAAAPESALMGGDVEEDTVFEPDEDAASADEANGIASLTAPTTPRILFLNGRGATVKAGNTSDSSTNTSFIVKTTTTFPASAHRSDPAKWGTIVATVKKNFERYNVTVVDEEPTSGSYLEAIITSGSPSLIGYGDSLGGIAPTRCGVVEKSIAFVFERRLGTLVDVGEVTSHELGHSLSLSHTQPATDLMSYSSSRESFLDVDAKCGPSPSQPQSCNCGGSTQNNHRQLVQFVGARTAATTPPPATTTPDAGTTAPPPVTTTGTVAIVKPSNGSTYVVGEPLDVQVDASKVANLRSAVLRWRIGTTTYQYGCPSTRCTVQNGVFTWRMVPGTGSRTFMARASDTAGATFDSATYTIRAQ